jgi:hypothetical protein
MVMFTHGEVKSSEQTGDRPNCREPLVAGPQNSTSRLWGGYG